MGALVSVVVPVFNGARYLTEALTSILEQTHRGLEAIVVDDGSTDASAALARSLADPRVRVLSQLRQGPGAARNHGVAQATGHYLAFLDADDTWEPRKTERQLAALAADPGLDMVFGHAVHVQATEVGPDAGTMRCSEPVPGHCLGTLLIRAAAFRRVGPFATRWRLGEFLDWHARAMDGGLRQVTLPDVVLHRRLHDANLGVRARPAQQDYARVIAGVLARRRR